MRISPSTYLEFKRCPRKVWYKKVAGMVEPPKDHLTFGTLVHAYQERYLLGRVMPVERAHDVYRDLLESDQRFAEQVRSYSDPGTLVSKASRAGQLAVVNGNYTRALQGSDLRVELRVQGTCGPLPYIGFADYIYEHDDMLCVGDHKTSSNPNGQYTYPKKGHIELDPQMLFYAYAVGKAAGYKGLVSLEHSYIPSRGKQTRVHRGQATWDAVEENWGRFIEAAHELEDLAEKEKPEDVAPNLSACSMFGGCPCKSICPSHKPKFNIEDVTMDQKKLDEIRAKIAARRAEKVEKVEKAGKVEDAPAKPESKSSSEVWPEPERPALGVNYTSTGEEFEVLGWTKYGGTIKLRVGEANEAMTRAQFDEFYGGGQEPLKRIRPPGAKEFEPSEKFEEAVADEEVVETKTHEALAKEIADHLNSTGLDPSKPYDAHSDNVIKDIVKTGLQETRAKKTDRRKVFNTGAAMGLWTVGDKDVLTDWGVTPGEEPASDGDRDRQGGAPVEVGPPPVQAQTTAEEGTPEEGGGDDAAWARVDARLQGFAEGVEEYKAAHPAPPPVVLLDCTCYGAVPLDNWMVFHNVEERYQALASDDRELQGLPYYAAPFGKGKPAMTMVLIDAIQKGALKLPPYLEISSSHPLAPTLVPALAKFHVLVVKGVR